MHLAVSAPPEVAGHTERHRARAEGEAAAVWQEGFAMMHFVLKWLLSPGRLLCLVPVFQPRGRQAGRQLMVADGGQLLVALRTRFSGGG